MQSRTMRTKSDRSGRSTDALDDRDLGPTTTTLRANLNLSVMARLGSSPNSKRACVVAGLFAGIGGLERGLGSAGHHSELLCEIDPLARAVLNERFPDVAIHADIRTLDSLP